MAAPYKSRAQIDKMRTFVAEGKITQEHFDACMALTVDHEKLPERLHEKKEPKEKKSTMTPEPGPDFG